MKERESQRALVVLAQCDREARRDRREEDRLKTEVEDKSCAQFSREYLLDPLE